MSQDCQVEVAVLETGLGGRLDATTATDPSWTALTPIALDHMDMLGDTVTAIAREKAGILRPGVPCFSTPQPLEAQDVVRSEAGRVGAPVTFLGGETTVPVPLKLPGRHQRTNARLAGTLAEAILEADFDRGVAGEAIETVAWPGRYQQLKDRPKVIFDVAHNPHGIAAFLETMAGESTGGRKWLVLGLQRGKRAEEILDLLLPGFDAVVLTQSDTRNFLPAAELAELAGVAHPCLRAEPHAAAAIKGAVAEAAGEDLVAIIGSHYLGPAVAGVFKISFDILS